MGGKSAWLIQFFYFTRTGTRENRPTEELHGRCETGSTVDRICSDTMLAAGTMMSNRVHVAGDEKGKVGKVGKGMTTNDRAAREILRRMFSVEHKMGLQAWWMRILLLPDQNARVTRLAYTLELYAVISGLVLFFVASFVDVDADGVLGKTSTIFAVFSVLNLLCVIGCCLPLGFAVVITTTPADLVLLLQPIGVEFIQIVFGTIGGLIAFALKLADQTDGIVLYVSMTMAALVFPYIFGQVGWYVMPLSPLELRHQWFWFKRVFEPQFMMARVRFGPNEPRAEEMLEQYLAAMPEDVRALALGEEGAA